MGMLDKVTSVCECISITKYTKLIAYYYLKYTSNYDADYLSFNLFIILFLNRDWTF